MAEREEDILSMNIYQRLAKVRKQVEVIQKNASGFNYKYVSEDEILARASGAMDKYHVSLIPKIVPGTFKVEPFVYDKSKVIKGEVLTEHITELMTTADMIMTWVNNDNPEDRIEVPWAMTGHQADGSQGFGTGLSYSYRYFLLKYFGIATPSDDPDNWRSKKNEADAAESKEICAAIISQIDEKVHLYLADHPEDRERLTDFTKRYVKGGNYKLIDNQTLATKMLGDLDTFIKDAPAKKQEKK